jgi:S1-C subfamily serine protease
MTARNVAVSFALAGVLLAGIPTAFAAGAPSAPPPKSAVAKPDAAASESKVDAEALFRAIVKVAVKAVPGARSSATLGAEREGSGIVIDKDGLIVTIGYLIVEADDVQITDSRNRQLPAKVVGYDHATGFGLLRSLVPLDASPIPFGDSGAAAEREPVLIANYGGVDDAAFAWIVSKRGFTGSWEYSLDQAIYTSPPTGNWSGAALIDKDGRLLGVGSLVVREATVGDPVLPGNVFVPIDALKPILADMVKSGRRAGPARPWLVVAADEVQGRLMVTRVSADGPAEKAGVQAGDIILGVNGNAVRTQAEFYQRVWTGRNAGAEVPLKLLQGVDVKEVSVKSIDRVEYFKPRPTY